MIFKLKCFWKGKFNLVNDLLENFLDFAAKKYRIWKVVAFPLLSAILPKKSRIKHVFHFYWKKKSSKLVIYKQTMKYKLSKCINQIQHFKNVSNVKQSPSNNNICKILEYYEKCYNNPTKKFKNLAQILIRYHSKSFLPSTSQWILQALHKSTTIYHSYLYFSSFKLIYYV